MSSAFDPSGLVPPRLHASLRILFGLVLLGALFGLSIVAVTDRQTSSSVHHLVSDGDTPNEKFMPLNILSKSHIRGALSSDITR